MRRARLKVAASIPVRRNKLVEPIQSVNNDSEADNLKTEESAIPAATPTTQLDKSSPEDALKPSESLQQLVPESKPSPDVTDAPSSTTVDRKPVLPAKVVQNVPEEEPSTSVTAPALESGKQDPEFKLISSSSEPVCTSPTKSLLGRSCFIKPVPRLDGHGRIRRNSIQGSGASASESEDESRRQPVPTSSQSRVENGQPSSDTGSTITSASGTTVGQRKRKIGMSESARKLVEARREFMLKHDNVEPDRSKLTMYDLIYYNPASNPMKKRDSKPKAKPSVEQPVVVAAEEEADDPDENAPIIAPRVTVDAEGRLVIDEKSLTIQRTGVQKAREMMAAQVAEEEDNYGSGFYKRRKRAKDWGILETIKFYKALNTVGTDFLLMQCLFPERSRQDLKLKFKKEERVNPLLLEKALTSYQVYDIDSLKEDLESCKGVEKTPTLNVKGEKDELNKSATSPPKRSKFRRVAASSIRQTGEADGQPPKQPQKPKKKVTEKKSKPKSSTCKPRKRKTVVPKPEKSKPKSSTCKPRKRKAPTPEECPLRPDDSIAGDLPENSDANHDDANSSICKLRSTRSGRKPRKVRRLIATPDPIPPKCIETSPGEDEIDTGAEELSTETPSEPDVENLPEKAPILSVEEIKNSFVDVNSVPPGSLVIVSKESSSDPDKTIVQVFMVSGNLENSEDNLGNTIRPLELSPEMLSIVTNVGLTSNMEETSEELTENKI